MPELRPEELDLIDGAVRDEFDAAMLAEKNGDYQTDELGLTEYHFERVDEDGNILESPDDAYEDVFARGRPLGVIDGAWVTGIGDDHVAVWVKASGLTEEGYQKLGALMTNDAEQVYILGRNRELHVFVSDREPSGSALPIAVVDITTENATDDAVTPIGR